MKNNYCETCPYAFDPNYCFSVECPIHKKKAERNKSIAKTIGHFIGGLLFQTPFLFFFM